MTTIILPHCNFSKHPTSDNHQSVRGLGNRNIDKLFPSRHKFNSYQVVEIISSVSGSQSFWFVSKKISLNSCETSSPFTVSMTTKKSTFKGKSEVLRYQFQAQIDQQIFHLLLYPIRYA